MQKYSIFNLVKNAFSNHENWDLAWKDPTPKEEYDVVIIGGGGHGLATAYYLAKEHNITNVAIIEKGWIGGGNVGRNTTIIRSNYMHDENGLFSEFGMDLWRKMSQDLNYNVMFSPRGIINLAHSDAQMNAYARRGNSMRLNGIDAVLLNREQVKEIIPMADFSENVRFPIFGGLMQPSAGTARHDAVAWGYARQADYMGVDIIQNCEVIGFDVSAGKIKGIRTSRGNIKVKTPTSSSTDYRGIIGGIDGTVSDATMLNANGYLDFPTPAMTAGTDYGCQYFVNLASTFNIDLWADSGYTIQVWIYLNRPLIYNDANAHNTANIENQINILSEKGNSNLDKNQWYLDGNYNATQAQNLQSTYDWHYVNNNISTQSYRDVLQNYGVDEVSSGGWRALTLTADKDGTIYPYTNFYVNASRIRADKRVSVPDTTAAPQAIGTFGLDPTTGATGAKPGMSFIGVMGPILTWNRELTYSQVVDSYAQLYQSLPTPS